VQPKLRRATLEKLQNELALATRKTVIRGYVLEVKRIKAAAIVLENMVMNE
jgi:hypothetical protein